MIYKLHVLLAANCVHTFLLGQNVIVHIYTSLRYWNYVAHFTAHTRLVCAVKWATCWYIVIIVSVHNSKMDILICEDGVLD